MYNNCSGHIVTVSTNLYTFLTIRILLASFFSYRHHFQHESVELNRQYPIRAQIVLLLNKLKACLYKHFFFEDCRLSEYIKGASPNNALYYAATRIMIFMDDMHSLAILY